MCVVSRKREICDAFFLDVEGNTVSSELGLLCYWPFCLMLMLRMTSSDLWNLLDKECKAAGRVESARVSPELSMLPSC